MLNEAEYSRKEEIFGKTVEAAQLFAAINDNLVFACDGSGAGFAGTVKYKDRVCFAGCRIDKKERTVQMKVFPGICVLPAYRGEVAALLKHIEMTYNPDRLTLTIEDNQVAAAKTEDFSRSEVTEGDYTADFLALFGYLRLISDYIAKRAAGAFTAESFREFIAPQLKKDADGGGA